jgi:hypothetical protein
LLSSTSADICELWSGEEIVRVLGNPDGMKDLIVVKRDVAKAAQEKNDNEIGIEFLGRVLDIQSAVRNGFLVPDKKASSRYLGWILKSREQHDLSPEELHKISNEPPSLTLNAQRPSVGPLELWIWVSCGLLLQLGVLAVPALTQYHWKWTEGGGPVAAYGYPCFLIGTLAVIVGLLGCSHIIEGTTTERRFRPGDGQDGITYVVRLQRSCTVSEQHFPSYAIFNPKSDKSIQTSRLNANNYR